MIALHILTASALCTFAFIMIAYSTHARRNGLRIGELYDADFSVLYAFAWLASIGALLFVYFTAGWWGPIIVLFVGFTVARFLLPLTEERIQLTAPLAVLILSIASVLMWLYSQ